MCGVIGISGLHDVNLRLYDALTILQHRGQDAAGIVTEDRGELHQCKGEGLVRDVFNKSHMMTSLRAIDFFNNVKEGKNCDDQGCNIDV